ncbi:PEP-utilizing enzyme [Jannaschia sp. S6380]|uniref:PEP/pyruvate-binding domain-containing protein n=1 Tax=Jannaschia sp. S6380 TaxID=2926408 RepID=UPI001FF45154|nr:PEP/pyruvate-binding domain-containing protein [Jannaschia sp. S6380]MCK0168415.1 PEP-utilizing enzyme [Jannaschia sp. S6380]
MTAILSTKSETLQNLAPLLRTARILPQERVTQNEWQTDGPGAVTRVLDRFGAKAALIVRSSALGEDAADASQAGAYASILDVCGKGALEAAIAEVFASFGAGLSDGDAVMVQPMLADVLLSGVAFTHDPTTAAPYRVVSLQRGADTTAVTAGKDGVETHVIAPGAAAVPEEIAPVLALLEELEALIPDRPLDIEYAICAGADGTVPYLLQARPLVLSGARAAMDVGEHGAVLDRIAARVAEAQRPHPYLRGSSTVFGNMPDWNPAEIIGTRPRPLALSLYRNLVTDATWAYQRHNYGYRNLRSFPLVQSFAGQPYVDVRLSFNSFIPADLDDAIADRLVDHYVDRLIRAPALHDKIEFEIVHSCYTLDLPDRIGALGDAGLDAKDRKAVLKSLRRLTNTVIHRKTGLWRTDARKIDTLRARHERITTSDLGPQERIYWLLEDCRRYGTLPFAGLARAGFMAVQLLRSLVATGVFSEDDYQRFMHSIDTVSSQFARDVAELDRPGFLARYGHLRPGTYDIRSPRYDEMPDRYLGAEAQPGETAARAPEFGLSLRQMRQIRDLLGAHRLSLGVVELMEFLHAGIEMREYAKFVFTRNLSDALAIFSEWGRTLGFSEDDLSYAHIGVVADLAARTDDPADVISHSIAEGRRRFAETERVWLPSLITAPSDVHAFRISEAEPNFVTQNAVTGPVVTLAENGARPADLAGAIVLIPSADPGYDWLFSHRIGGLVTAYGGVNSHMAIRAGELQLPAVIGAGEALFKRWSSARRLRLDCAGHRVERVA